MKMKEKLIVAAFDTVTWIQNSSFVLSLSFSLSLYALYFYACDDNYDKCMKIIIWIFMNAYLELCGRLWMWYWQFLVANWSNWSVMDWNWGGSVG